MNASLWTLTPPPPHTQTCWRREAGVALVWPCCLGLVTAGTSLSLASDKLTERVSERATQKEKEGKKGKGGKWKDTPAMIVR